MANIFDSMSAFFVSDGWEFQQIEGQPILRMNFAGDAGRWTCFAQAREEQEQFLFYSRFPVNAPEDKRALVSEFITRANYAMINGNFEMDWSDGEVRYKTMIDAEGIELVKRLVKNVVYANVLTVDRYYAGLMAVIYGDKSPIEAIESIEAGKR